MGLNQTGQGRAHRRRRRWPPPRALTALPRRAGQAATPERRAPFMGRNFAHRGLHRIDKSVPENSIPAFEHAARIGYGIELDVHLTAAGELVVFHDDGHRSASAAWRAASEDLTLGQLRASAGCAARTTPSRPWRRCWPPSPGRMPADRRAQARRAPTASCAARCYEVMQTYPGPWCVESFDPLHRALVPPARARGAARPALGQVRQACSSSTRQGQRLRCSAAA